jgi:hypothetical protein
MSDLPGSDQVSGAIGSGRSAINGFDPTAVANSNDAKFNSGFSSQVGSGPQSLNDYMKAYSGTVAANPKVQDLYTTANGMFNVPALQNQATYLNNQVTNQLPLQQSLMRGFDASQGQIRLYAISNHRQPLQQLMQILQQDLHLTMYRQVRHKTHRISSLFSHTVLC